MTRKNRKAQEEIVGFVLIVVIVVVVGLVFFIISAKSPESSVSQESREIAAFLSSVGEYTSECSVSSGSYRKLSELLNDCWKDKKCISGEKSCQVLNRTLSGILNASWNAGEGSALEGYELDAYYSRNASNAEQDRESIISIERGNCDSGILRSGSGFYSAYPGTITYSLKLCYSEG